MGGSYSEVLSAQDVATWGALCALATFNRGELKRLVIDNLGFREYLETVPEVNTPQDSAGYESAAAGTESGLLQSQAHGCKLPGHECIRCMWSASKLDPVQVRDMVYELYVACYIAAL